MRVAVIFLVLSLSVALQYSNKYVTQSSIPTIIVQIKNQNYEYDMPEWVEKRVFRYNKHILPFNKKKFMRNIEKR